MKKLSELIPKLEGEEINVGIWDEHTPYENKLELWEGVPLGEDGIQRDRLAICLIYSMEFKHLVEILHKQSKNYLLQFLHEEQS